MAMSDLYLVNGADRGRTGFVNVEQNYVNGMSSVPSKTCRSPSLR